MQIKSFSIIKTVKILAGSVIEFLKTDKNTIHSYHLLLFIISSLVSNYIRE